jgi:MFS family permease
VLSTKAHRVYLVGLLAAISGFAGAERVALSLVMERIKVDVALTDTQLGLATGFVFSLCYSATGFPLARWADRGNRVVVLAVSAAISSVAVSITGLGTTFFTFLAVRGAVGMADAGFLPAAMSLLTDYFSRRERPRAIAAFLQGGVVCVFVGNFVAGLISQYYGWRLMFLVLGLPGVALAAIAWLTLTDPRNVAVSDDGLTNMEPGSQEIPRRRESQLSIGEAIRQLARNRSYTRLLIAFSAANFSNTAIALWVPSFFIRS